MEAHEAFVNERQFRQFRAIGDGLAWRVFHYDRTIIAALSSNMSPGPLVKRTGRLKDDATGLSSEIRQIDGIWRERKNFALHHDLTNCLRIGDLTEIEGPGRYGLHEVKTNLRNRSRAQDERMRKAVQTIVAGEPLPGSGRHVVELDVQYRSDVQALIDLVGLARQHGIRGTKLQRGRALIVTSFSDLDRVTGSDVSLRKATMPHGEVHFGEHRSRPIRITFAASAWTWLHETHCCHLGRFFRFGPEGAHVDLRRHGV